MSSIYITLYIIFVCMNIIMYTFMSIFLIFMSIFLIFFSHLHHNHPNGSKHGKKGRRRKLPPGPAPWPIFGSLLTMLRNKPYFRWVLAIAEGHDITCIRLGAVHTIVINSPELSREFLKKHDASFASRPLTMATEYSGRNFLSVVICPYGDQWKKMRRVVASEVLSQSRIRSQSNLRLEEADFLIHFIYNQWKNHNNVAIDLRVITRFYAGNVIRRMIFGTRWLNEREGVGGIKEEVDYVEAAFTVLSLVYSFCPSDLLPWLRWLDLDGHEQIMRRAIQVINRYHDPIIEERVKMWKEGRKKEVEDVLDTFITLKNGNGSPLLTTEEIKAQSAELIFAAVDNPSNITEWALAHLLDEPSLLHKAVQELDHVVGKDRLVQESDLPKLGYIKAIARETARLHPMAAFNLPHVALADTNVAGYDIPKGSYILLSRVGLGRNPKVWANPLRFDPERHFADVKNPVDVELAEPDLRFVTFTVGRRSCMGQVLGSLMTYMLLARLIQAFDWSLPQGERVELCEERSSLFLNKPLLACANPRLPLNLLEQI